jgi:hypothetical protein
VWYQKRKSKKEKRKEKLGVKRVKCLYAKGKNYKLCLEEIFACQTREKKCLIKKGRVVE